MKAARNVKELEKMFLEDVKKKLPGATRDYCHKWYDNHSEMKEIVSEVEFVQMVNDSLDVSICNGEVRVSLEIFKNQRIEDEHLECMTELWKEFKSGYVNYVFTKILK